MSKINYHKAPIKKASARPVESIVGRQYLADYKQRLKKVDDIRRTTEQTMKLSEKAFISQFTEEISNPNIDDLCKKINDEISAIDHKYAGWGKIIYSCLTSCDDDELIVSSKKLQTIRLPSEITKAQSNKVQNLVLNWKKLLGSLLDAAMFCADFKENMAIKIIYIFCRVVLTGGSEIKDLTRIDFDEESAVILHCVAKMSMDNWLDEDEVVDKVLAAYSLIPEVQKPSRHELKTKITKLAGKYHCIDIDNGRIRLVEKVILT